MSVFESLKFGSIPTVAIISLSLTMATALGYAFTHRALMKHALATSEHFVVAHPTLDIVALVLALVLILTTTAAKLQ